MAGHVWKGKTWHWAGWVKFSFIEITTEYPEENKDNKAQTENQTNKLCSKFR